MESKKRRALFKDCQAVSEVIGQILMVGIVIIAVSTIALSVFSECGTMKPAPCTYIQEKIDTKTHCVYITHSEGEAINLSAIKIILTFPDGHRDEFSKSKPVPFNFSEGSSGLEDNVFGVGDCIKINDVNITSGNDIEMFYVYTPSQLVIRHIVLHAPTNTTSTDPTSTDPTSTDPTSTDSTSTDSTSTDTTSTNTTSTDTTPSMVVNQKPVANFTINITEGYVPLYVQFTDHSENATGWSWDFEDGETSTERNPTHTYSKVGTYTVNQTATNVIGTDSKLAIISVLKRTPTISWNTPADITYGTALSSAQLNAQANVLGNLVYTPAIGTVLNAGTQILHVNFTPTDIANYNTASKDVAIDINKANPIITWSKPADIYRKTKLSDTQLNAVASVPGTFVYTPPLGTELNAGTYTLKVDFTPTNTTNYNTASADVQINVIATPIADFTATPTSGKHPLDVQFTDTSKSTDAYYWYWNFGDQSTSTDHNPTHKYTKVGTYAVSLTVKDIFGTSTTTKTGYIIVSN